MPWMPSTWRHTRRPNRSRSSSNPVWSLVAYPLLDLYVEALDLLVQRGERNLEVFCGLSLIPVAALQPVGDDAPLNLFHQIEQRCVGLMVQQTRGVGAAGQLRRQQVRVDRSRGGEHNPAP